MDDNNNFVMRINDSMNSIGDSSIVKTMLDEVSKQNHSIQDMNQHSKELSDAISNISEEMTKINSTVQNALTISQESVSGMNNTIQTVNESVHQINSINDKVLVFHDKINQVTELSKNTASSAETIVHYVNELQTSIDELTLLVQTSTDSLVSGTQKVQSSVENINSLSNQMDLINQSVSIVNDSVHTQLDVNDLFSNTVNEIANGFTTLANDCVNTGVQFYKMGRAIDTTRNDMVRGFSRLPLLDMLNVYKMDHLTYTWRIYNNLAHFEHLKITQLNNPTGCKFGLWANGELDEKIKNSNAFRDCMKYHDGIHKYGCESWYAAEESKTGDALNSFYKTLENYNLFAKSIDALRDHLKSIGYRDETKIIVYRA